MKKITNLRFFVPLVFIASIFLGPAFNFIVFFYNKIPNSYWSLRITDLQFADIMAITVILFSIIFLISYKYSENISYEPAISFCLVIIGFSCIYAAFATSWIIFLIPFIVIGIASGFILPKIIDLIVDTSRVEKIKIYQTLFLPICIIVWLLIHSIIFELIGLQSWRISYLMIGILNIASSPSIFLYKQFE
ncbi:MAG: hypothetical protein ACFE8L_09800 [Candidatus Hodarchaeota archaeon]